jgi:hypothetical protein
MPYKVNVEQKDGSVCLMAKKSFKHFFVLRQSRKIQAEKGLGYCRERST